MVCMGAIVTVSDVEEHKRLFSMGGFQGFGNLVVTGQSTMKDNSIKIRKPCQ